MQLLKFLSLLLVLLIVAVISGLFLPDEMKASASISIQASPQIVCEQVQDLKKWRTWSPWGGAAYSSDDRTKPQKMYWEDSLLGICELHMIHYDSLKSAAANFDFGEGYRSNMVWLFDTLDGKTQVNWVFKIPDLSIMERYFAYFSNNTMDDGLFRGLKQLKTISEALKYSRVDKIEVIELPLQPAVTMKDSVTEEKVHSRLAEMDNYLRRFLNRRSIQPVDSLFIQYDGKANDTLYRIEAGFPIPERTWVWRTLNYKPLPEGTVVAVKYLGSEYPQKAYDAAQLYMNDTGYRQNGTPWHKEMFDRTTDTDSTNWITWVYFPVTAGSGD